MSPCVCSRQLSFIEWRFLQDIRFRHQLDRAIARGRDQTKILCLSVRRTEYWKLPSCVWVCKTELARLRGQRGQLCFQPGQGRASAGLSAFRSGLSSTNSLAKVLELNLRVWTVNGKRIRTPQATLTIIIHLRLISANLTLGRPKIFNTSKFLTTL